jgi:hypothetical protein
MYQNTKGNVQPVDNNIMKEKERRKYPRIVSSNLIFCYCLDKAGNDLSHCITRAVDVSPVGVKVETFKDINSEMVRLMSTDSEGSLIDIKGRVVHRHQSEDGRYNIGISLEGTEAENTRFMLKLINACHQTEPELVMQKGARNEKKERRIYPRVETSNLISYSCLDEYHNEMDQCIATALDINPVGAKIETYQEILSDNIHLTAIDGDDNMIEIVGKVVHTHKAEDGRYELGINLVGTKAEKTKFALKLIDACHKVEPAFIMVKSA